MSETYVRTAAGWSSGAMVARYTRALSGELAVEEFQRSWVVSGSVMKTKFLLAVSMSASLFVGLPSPHFKQIGIKIKKSSLSLWVKSGIALT